MIEYLKLDGNGFDAANVVKSARALQKKKNSLANLSISAININTEDADNINVHTSIPLMVINYKLMNIAVYLEILRGNSGLLHVH